MDDCCLKGFKWDGTAVGHEDKLGGRNVYVTGNNAHRAIMLCHDGFGWKWVNARLLADHFAQEVGATVYIPDFFDGWGATADAVQIRRGEDGSMRFEFISDNFDWAGWMSKNSLEARTPDILASARELRSRYAKLGAVGYCWGGQAGFMLADKALGGLFDCVSIAHPGTPTQESIRNAGVPFQVLAPEHDPTFSQELKDLCNAEIPKAGVNYVYQYFPGMVHGFATKCEEKNEEERKALEMAKNAVVYWMTSHLL